MISKTKIKERTKKKSNPALLENLRFLRNINSPFWTRVAGLISKPKRKSIAVNIEKINKYTKEGEVVVVPGKVLGQGEMNHKITLASVASTEDARNKVKIIKISDLVNKNPKGEGIKIIM
jgi:large subunit ribosomal protein L18e